MYLLSQNIDPDHIIRFAFDSDDDVDLLDPFLSEEPTRIRQKRGFTVNSRKFRAYIKSITSENDHYYVYYHYESKEKIYHYRFDSIRSIEPGSKKDEMNISKDKITEQIKLSSDSFLSGEKALVNIKILNHSKRIAERLLNDFPSGILTNEGICVRTAVNNMFYSKLCAYGKDIVILNEDIKRRYYTYLLEITMDNNQ